LVQFEASSVIIGAVRVSPTVPFQLHAALQAPSPAPQGLQDTSLLVAIAAKTVLTADDDGSSSQAQHDFIERIRQEVDCQDDFFYGHDWRMIKPNTCR
jgi:hypothetical protein